MVSLCFAYVRKKHADKMQRVVYASVNPKKFRFECRRLSVWRLCTCRRRTNQGLDCGRERRSKLCWLNMRFVSERMNSLRPQMNPRSVVTTFDSRLGRQVPVLECYAHPSRLTLPARPITLLLHLKIQTEQTHSRLKLICITLSILLSIHSLLSSLHSPLLNKPISLSHGYSTPYMQVGRIIRHAIPSMRNAR